MDRQHLDSILSDIRKVRIGGARRLLPRRLLGPRPRALRALHRDRPRHAGGARRSATPSAGAGNVAANLVALGRGPGAAPSASSGPIPSAGRWCAILAATGVDTAGVLVQEAGWETPVYVKPDRIGQGAEQDRFRQRERPGPRGRGGAAGAASRGARRGLDLLIVNQQLAHGIHTPAFRAALAELLAERGPGALPTVVDSRACSDEYAGAMRKINDREALRLRGEAWEGDEPVPRERVAARPRTSSHGGQSPCSSPGGRGASSCATGTACTRCPACRCSGASTLSARATARSRASPPPLPRAAAASRRPSWETSRPGSTVQKLFTTGTASPAEILAIGSDPDYVHEPELAADPRRARLAEGTEIEVVTAASAGRRITHAIFDNDGTISTLREGWERIMEPMMIRADPRGGLAAAAEQGLFESGAERVRDYIDATTGSADPRADARASWRWCGSSASCPRPGCWTRSRLQGRLQRGAARHGAGPPGEGSSAGSSPSRTTR